MNQFFDNFPKSRQSVSSSCDNLNNNDCHDDVKKRNTNVSLENSCKRSSSNNDSSSISKRKRFKSFEPSILMNNRNIKQWNSNIIMSEGIASLHHNNDLEPSINNPIPITLLLSTPTREVTKKIKKCSYDNNNNKDCIEYKSEYNDYSNVPIEFFEQKTQQEQSHNNKQQNEEQQRPNSSSLLLSNDNKVPLTDNKDNEVNTSSSVAVSSSSSSKTTKSKFRRHNKFPTTLHRMLQYCDKHMNMKIRVNDEASSSVLQFEGDNNENNMTSPSDYNNDYYYPYDIIRWDYHGRSFSIYDKQKLVQYLFPKFFPYQKEYSSFQRQLNLYGFINISVYNQSNNNANICNRDNNDTSMQSPSTNDNKQISHVQVQPVQQTCQTQYYHELFLRTRSDLCLYLCRLSSTVHHHNLATAKGAGAKKKKQSVVLNKTINDVDNENDNKDNCSTTNTVKATPLYLVPNFDLYPPLISSSSKQTTEYTSNNSELSLNKHLCDSRDINYNAPNGLNVDKLSNTPSHPSDKITMHKPSSIANYQHSIVNHHDNNSISMMSSYLHPGNAHSDTRLTTTLIPIAQQTGTFLNHTNNSIVRHDDISRCNNNVMQHIKDETQKQHPHLKDQQQHQQQHHLGLIQNHQQQQQRQLQQHQLQPKLQIHHPSKVFKYSYDEVMTNESIHQHYLEFQEEYNNYQQQMAQPNHQNNNQRQQRQKSLFRHQQMISDAIPNKSYNNNFYQQEQDEEVQKQHKFLHQNLQQQQQQQQQQQHYQHQEQQMQQEQDYLQQQIQQQQHPWHCQQQRHHEQQIDEQQSRDHQQQQHEQQNPNELDLTQMQWHHMQQVYESQVQIGIEHPEKIRKNQVEPQNIISLFDGNEFQRTNSGPVLLTSLPKAAGHSSNTSNLSYRLNPFVAERIDVSMQKSDAILTSAFHHSSNQFNVPREQSIISTTGETKWNDMESQISQFLTNKITASDWNHHTSLHQSRHPSNLDAGQGST